MATNKETDEKAIDLVWNYEKQQGRTPERIYDKDAGYDLYSGGRKIELKGAGHGEVFKGFVIEEKQHGNFNDPDFWLYRVLKVSSDNPIILPIRPNEINLSTPQIRYNATSFKDKAKPNKYT